MLHQYTTSGVSQSFIESLPHRPYAGSRKNELRKTWASDALPLAYIQSDRPTLTSWMKFDVDYQQRGGKLIRGRRETGARWIDVGLPRPHFIVRSKTKDSCHYYYGLKTPVIEGANARALPQRLFSQVASAMTYLLDADVGYRGHTGKNPLSPAWFTDTYEGELYELNDLKDALPSSLQAFPGTDALGVGRNCHLFSVVLAWAYAEVSEVRGELTMERWQDIVTQQAHEFNRYSPRLPRAEVDGIGKRCGKYSWNGYTRRYKGEVAELKRSQRLSHLREPLEEGEAQRRMSESGLITSAKRRNQRDDGILAALASLIAEGVSQPSRAQIAERAGISVSTVGRWQVQQNVGTPGN